MRADPVPREVHDSLWLQLRRDGLSAAGLAARFGVSARTVQLALARARAREQVSGGEARPPRHLPPLVPLFPIGPFTPRAACPHHGPLRPGTVLCCMVCNRSGMDGHPDLFRDPRDEPRPERRPEPAPPEPCRETRRQRRARRQAHSPADGGPPKIRPPEGGPEGR